MDFNSSVEHISSDQLDALFNDAPITATPGANELVIGSKITQDGTVNVGQGSIVPHIDLDNLDDPILDVPVGKDDNKSPDTTKNTPDTPPPADTTQVDDKGEENQEGQDEPPTNEGEQEQVKVVLKNTVNYLVERGLWQDFDGREALDVDADTYAELAAKQEETKIADLFNELVDSTGAYGKAIISHIKNGGDPDEIIDIFKEQKQIQNIDLSDISGQEAMVAKYYSEVVGWNKNKIDKYINSLKGEEDGLETEAKELQSKYDKIYQDQVNASVEASKQREKELKKQQQDYINTLSATVDNFDDFTDKEKKLVKDSVLKFNKKLEDGTPVNEFYLKFYEIQKNPKEYVELIHYIMDKKGYQEKIKQKEQAKATDKTWNFVKGNGSISKKGSDITPKSNAKTSKIDFSGLFKK